VNVGAWVGEPAVLAPRKSATVRITGINVRVEPA